MGPSNVLVEVAELDIKGGRRDEAARASAQPCRSPCSPRIVTSSTNVSNY